MPQPGTRKPRITRCSRQRCKALRALAHAAPERCLGATAMDRWTAGRTASSPENHKAMVRLKWDTARREKTANIKRFLIHPRSRSPLERNSSVAAQGLLKAEPAQGKGGLPLPHTPL